jgi:hypothetical protein
MAMIEYGYNLDGEVLKIKLYEEGQQPVLEGIAKGVWLPVVGLAPFHNPLTEDLAGPTLVPGETEIVRTWTVTDKSLVDRKTALQAAAQAKFEETFFNGFIVSFGTLEGKVLQIRNSEDRTNWLTSKSGYGDAIEAGAGAMVGARFRTQDNITYTLSYSEGYAVLAEMGAWGGEVYRRLWEIKDAIDEAVDVEALDLIDIEAGWPA